MDMTRTLRVTVCQLADDPAALESDWEKLSVHIRAAKSDLVLLPEMPFAGWFPRSRKFDARVWQQAVDAHLGWLAGLGALAPAAVLGSRPVNAPGGQRYNEAFVWQPDSGVRPAHRKRYLPDEAGFWEASWYERGPGRFEPVAVGAACAGFAICTDLWFFEHARAYGRAGAHLLANPRATERATVDKWLAAGRAAAVVAGAYCLSSNRAGAGSAGAAMGGQGWIIDPDGAVLALTSQASPFATVTIDLAAAERARHSYPRYVEA
jgi:N-carbamoylputrescine amidase